MPWENTPWCCATTSLRSEEHTSELQSESISYAVFCLKKKKKHLTTIYSPIDRVSQRNKDVADVHLQAESITVTIKEAQSMSKVSIGQVTGANTYNAVM